MTAVIAFGAVDALGDGAAAFGLDAHETAVRRDEELAAAGLTRPLCARASAPPSPGVDRAAALLARAMDACLADLARAMPDYRARRVGLALGTSSGGMRALEADLGLAGTYLGPVLASGRPLSFEPFSLVLGACASGTLAIGVGRAWLAEGKCDVVLAGGFDAVSVFVASGFEVLRAVCSERPLPFRAKRDGLALGEGAALVAMVRADVAPRGSALAWVTGFGASCDAVHLTAPDRTGAGLARAAEGALAEAGRRDVGLVSAHGTATEYNDAAEAKAIAAVLGLDPVPVHALKGSVGHTLGAAGALEALAAIHAMRAGVAPPSCGAGPTEAGVRVLDAPEAHEAAVALKLSAAFGGANAALVIERDAPRAAAPTMRRGVRSVHASQAVAVTGEPDARALAATTGYPEDRIARGDGLVRLALAAVGELQARVGPLAGAGVVVGHGLATLETNRLYLARIRSVGAARGEPRRFPYTTPNAAAGECAVAFGLTGPSFAVGGGPHGGLEALMVATDLVATGAAERVVVVAVDEAGEASLRLAPETRSGAVALVVAARPAEGPPWARVDDVRVRLEPGPLACPAAMHAHAALLPLAAGRPDRLSVDLPWGGFANASLFWL